MSDQQYENTIAQLDDRIAALETENAKLREALMAAEESLATYVGSFGYKEGGKQVLKQVREALEKNL